METLKHNVLTHVLVLAFVVNVLQSSWAINQLVLLAWQGYCLVVLPLLLVCFNFSTKKNDHVPYDAAHETAFIDKTSADNCSVQNACDFIPTTEGELSMFAGEWCLVRQTGFDDYLKLFGVPWPMRKMACSTSTRQTITFRGGGGSGRVPTMVLGLRVAGGLLNTQHEYPLRRWRRRRCRGAREEEPPTAVPVRTRIRRRQFEDRAFVVFEDGIQAEADGAAEIIEQGGGPEMPLETEPVTEPVILILKTDLKDGMKIRVTRKMIGQEMVVETRADPGGASPAPPVRAAQTFARAFPESSGNVPDRSR